MMKLLTILFLFVICSCSKTNTTSAKLKLSLSGITDMSNGIGSGGAILFGKNSKGDVFGKVITSAEENMELPNGSWSFYAVMWDKSNSATPMNGKVHCGKSSNNLTGIAASISMNLTNSICSDPEFSDGKYYLSSGNLRFPDIFVEECDDVNAATDFKCGARNQGSALSYRIKFQNYNKNSAGGIAFGAGVIASGCNKMDDADNVNDIRNKGLPINFPTGNGSTSFVVSIELFFGTNDCNPADPKGVQTIVLNQGLGIDNGINHKIVKSDSLCTVSTSDFVGTPEAIKNKCEDYLGSMNTGLCNASSVYPIMSRFAPANECATQTNFNPAIKHLFSIPKDVLCRPYDGISSMIGTHPFAGGDGSRLRPFKICNEWQINQIGEVNAPLDYSNHYYKLMNDLDMNKTDFGPYSKPNCSGVAGALIEKHTNFNPLDKIVHGLCSTVKTSENKGFEGLFDGNFKTISNIRVEAKTIIELGFVRSLFGGAVIKNLNFKNLEFRGKNRVGGVAGFVQYGKANISNINIDDFHLEGRGVDDLAYGDYIGGITGYLDGFSANESVIVSAKVSNGKIKGRNYVGGLVGFNAGIIEKSMYRGKIFGIGPDASTYFGGLVGYNSSNGQILQSFSEGYLTSQSVYLGGIAARNSGLIQDVYSTMFLNPRASVGSIYAGGILGKNEAGGTVSDCFSDNKYKYTGGATPFYGGVIGDMTAQSVPAGNCYTHNLNSSSPFSGFNYLDMRTSSAPAGIIFVNPSKWTFNADILPHLAWENRECDNIFNRATVPAQALLGRGTSVKSPIIICNADQFLSIATRAANEFYRIAQDLNLISWGPSSILNDFNGTLDGGFFNMYGANLAFSGSSAEDIGLIKSNNGNIKNLNLIGNSIANSDATDFSTGMLSGANFGSISNITFLSNSLIGKTNVGMTAGRNDHGSGLGKIENIILEDAITKGNYGVGGVVGFNGLDAIISKVSNNGVMRNLLTSYQNIGGVVGRNEGQLDQAQYSGFFEFSASSTAPSLNAGGIVGLNNSSGSVSNVFTKTSAKIIVKNFSNVGGLIGNNLGTLATSFALGKVVFDNSGSIATAANNFHPLVGNSMGNSDSFYLENNAVSLLESHVLVTCNGSSGNFLGSAAPKPYLLTSSVPAQANLFENANQSNSESINPLIVMTVPTNYQFYFTPAWPSCGISNATFYRNYILPNTMDQLGALAFSDPISFSAFDLAYTSTTSPAFSTQQDRLFDYYLSRMEKRLPLLVPPIWKLEEGDDYPNLVQLND